MSSLKGLRDYFQELANKLESDRTATSIFPNRSDAGSTREEVLLTILTDHLPARCRAVKGGFIFDIHGNVSKQIDLLITTEATLQFRQWDKSFNCIEGCYGAITVKTTLDKTSLFDALDNIASIPLMPDPGQALNPNLANRDMYLELPFKAVFAFDGIASETLNQRIAEYYATHDVPLPRRPEMIIVNNRYLFVKTRAGDRRIDGVPVPPDLYFPMFGEQRQVGAYGLVRLLTQIQEASNWGSHVILSFAKYVDAMWSI